MADKNSKSFPSDEEAAAWIDKWSNGEVPYDRHLDYAAEPGDPIPPVHKSTWLDRLWKWIRP